MRQKTSVHRQSKRTPDLPGKGARQAADEPDSCGSHADVSNARMDVQSIGNATETAADEAERVRTRRMGSVTRNSPNGIQITTAKPTSRWKRVSIGDGDVYVPSNTPIEVLGTASRRIVFGQVESGIEGNQRSVEGERASDGDGDGDGNRGDGEGDTTSGGDIDSKRVEAALLAGDSQLERQSRRIQMGNLPVLSVPPIQSERRPYGLVRHRRRCRRLKIERINVSKVQQGETTYLGRAHVMQPPGNASNHAYMVYRPRRQRDHIKSVPRNVSRVLEVKKTYLGHANAMRSIRRPKKRISRVNKLTFNSKMPGEPWCNDGDYG